MEKISKSPGLVRAMAAPLSLLSVWMACRRTHYPLRQRCPLAFTTPGSCSHSFSALGHMLLSAGHFRTAADGPLVLHRVRAAEASRHVAATKQSTHACSPVYVRRHDEIVLRAAVADSTTRAVAVSACPGHIQAGGQRAKRREFCFHKALRPAWICWAAADRIRHWWP